MRILVDYFSLVYSFGGIRKYIENILKKIAELDSKNEYILLDFKNQAKNIFALKKPNFKIKNSNFFSPRLYKKLVFMLKFPPLDFFTGTKSDIAYFINFTTYPVKAKKKILTVYDLSFIYFPQFLSSNNLYFLKKAVKKSIKEASKIITISASVKKEIIKEFNVKSGDIEIISPAVDLNFFRPQGKEKVDSTLEKYKIKGSYFLFTSTLEPRKNIEGIVTSYSSLPQEIKDEYSLVLAGGKGWQDENLLKQIEKAKSEGESIIQTGYVPEEDLPALYSGASLFLFPSFYEGFGIPILEAMACSVPVITSNISSMPKVAGDAAILVDPKSTEEIKEAIIKVLKNDDLREDMKRKGLKQSKKFSWDESAKKLIQVFEEVYPVRSPLRRRGSHLW